MKTVGVGGRRARLGGACEVGPWEYTVLEKQKLQTLLEVTRLQLLSAQISFDTWLELVPTEDNNKLDILNTYKGFFVPASSAFLDRCFIKIAIVTDRKYKKAPSLHRVVQQLKLVPGLVTEGGIQDLTKRLEEQRSVEKRVRVALHTK